MNEEEIKYKITVPSISDEELQTIDFYYNEMVEKFVKQNLQEKEQIITQRIMFNLQKENQKLKEQLQQKENQKLKEQLQQKEYIINKAKEFAKEHIFQFDGDKDFDALLEILDNKGE